MITILEQSERDILGIKVEHSITHADYAKLNPIIEKIIYQYGYINLLLWLDNVTGWHAETAFEDFKFGFKHYKDIKKLAVVGEQPWNGWLQKFTAFFVEEEVRYFSLAEIDNAWQWIAKPLPITKYECTICGFIYDEKQGFSESNIIPNTKWHDLPKDWHCPDCQEDKTNFAAIENGGSGLIQTLRVNDKAYY